MKKALFKPFRDSALLSRVGAMAACVLLSAGCESLNIPIHKPAGNYKPQNVFAASDYLPSRIRRVAVLPVTTAQNNDMLVSGVDALEPVMHSEVEKSKRFEVIVVSREDMRLWFGKADWRADERLPRDLFARLHDATGCDAVLFCQLTKYAPYQPISVGWKISLAEGDAPAGTADPKFDILWSADETFDAGTPSVANAAQSYYSQHLRRETPSSDSNTVLASPTRFGEYTLSALFNTLPKRSEK